MYHSSDHRGFAPGNWVNFGRYPGESDSSAEPILWQVLDQKEDRFLLLSDTVLDVKPFDSAKDGTSPSGHENWTGSSLCSWLNGPFARKAFTKDELSRIGLPLFLLSTDEVARYFTEPGHRARKTELVGLKQSARSEGLSGAFTMDLGGILASAFPSAYAAAKGATAVDDIPVNEFVLNRSMWWLRSPGDGPETAAVVLQDGSIFLTGMDVRLSLGVRPALWLSAKVSG